ncbi:MAG TPA: CHAT domain-containing tetratricopeptide repeat protein [Pirellulales bacterium]
MRSSVRTACFAAAVGFILVSPSPAAEPAKSPRHESPPSASEAIKWAWQSAQLFKQGKYRDAIPPTKKLLDSYSAAFGNDSRIIVKWLNNLGTLYSLTGDFREARVCLDRALKIEQRTDGKSLATADALDSLGILLEKTGELKDARRCFEQALAIYNQHRPKSLRTADICNNLGIVLHTQGEFARGRNYQEQAVAIYEETGGKANPTTGMMLSNLGESMRQVGEFESARTCFEKSVAILEIALPPNHPNRGAVLHNYATLLAQMHQYKAARTRFLQAIEIDEAALGDHSRTAAAHAGLGLLYFWMRDYDAAQRSYERALEIETKVFSKNSVSAAVVLVNLGNLFLVRNHYDEARRCLEQGLAIFRSNLGERSLKTARTLLLLAMLEAKLERWTTAAELADKSRRIVRSNSMQLLSVLAEREQLAYLAQYDRSDWHAGLTIGLARPDDPQLANLSATWLLNGKENAQEASAGRVLAARRSANTETSDVLKRLFEVQMQIAKLSQIATNAENLENHQARMSELGAEEAKLTRRLGEVGVISDGTNPWIPLDALRASLPDGAVMVNVIRLLVPRLKESVETATPRYIAWVIPKAGDGNVKIVDLGPASAIDKSVVQVRQDTENQTASSSLEELSRKVYGPLAEYLKDADQWIVSPDGSLWLVPWQMLLIGNGQYAVERYRISYAMSGRELVKNDGRFHSEEPGVAMANPDFSAALDPPAEPPFHLAIGDDWRAPDGKLPKKWARLPGTAQEIESTLPQMTSYLGKKPHVFIGGAATETVFKRSRQPRVAVLSTHGFFLPEQEAGLRIEDPVAARASPSLRLDNPLLRTGLVLAGANHHGTLTADELALASDDGILTGLEIVGIDLRGTEMVVLSACNSGLGDVRAGEGVAGLRHAFQLAGADAVLATLWKIPDTETAWLMDQFWKSLAAGSSKADALRTAQLMILYHRDKLLARAARERRESTSTARRGEGEPIDFDPARIKPPAGSTSSPRPGLAAPIYWAAFTLTGE